MGECHRYPPHAVSWNERCGRVTGKTNACERAEWPVLNEDNRCGEFRSRDRVSVETGEFDDPNEDTIIST